MRSANFSIGIRTILLQTDHLPKLSALLLFNSGYAVEVKLHRIRHDDALLNAAHIIEHPQKGPYLDMRPEAVDVRDTLLPLIGKVFRLCFIHSLGNSAQEEDNLLVIVGTLENQTLHLTNLIHYDLQMPLNSWVAGIHRQQLKAVFSSVDIVDIVHPPNFRTLHIEVLSGDAKRVLAHRKLLRLFTWNFAHGGLKIIAHQLLRRGKPPVADVGVL